MIFWLHVQINETAFEFFQCRPHFFFLSIKLLIALGLCPRAEKGGKEGERDRKRKSLWQWAHFSFPLLHSKVSERRRSSHGKKGAYFHFFKCGKVHDEKITFNPFPSRTRKRKRKKFRRRGSKKIFALPPYPFPNLPEVNVQGCKKKCQKCLLPTHPKKVFF